MNNFTFNPQDCNKLYFKELFLLLDKIRPEEEKFNVVKRKTILGLINKLKIKCDYDFISCKPDEFFFENKKQIVLGRFYDTIGCYYKCRGHYFIIELDPYTVFKQDIFLRYVIDKPELYITNSTKFELEHVFPVRIIINEKNEIPTYTEKKIDNMDHYVNDPFTGKNNVTAPHNLKIINDLPNTSLLKKYTTNSNVVTRELCILYSMKIHFYIVKDKPFILVSKYNLQQIKAIYIKYNKQLPMIQYFFRKNKTRRNLKK